MTIRKAVATTILCLLVVVLVVPFESTVMPPASVRVVDQGGNPMPRVLVKQEWKDVIVEEEIHVDSVRTDENGMATFPKRTVRSFMIKRMLTIAWRILTQAQHASLWSHGAITAYSAADPYVWAWAGYYTSGAAWPERLELKRQNIPLYP
jgi:hypothetical protein